jgi:hypothetical protein
VNCGHSLDLGPDGKCTWWFDAEWLTEADLRIRAETDGWNDAWLTEVLTKPNQGCVDLLTGWTNKTNDWLLNGVGYGLQFDRQHVQRVPMFQVLTVYRIAVNQAGIPPASKPSFTPTSPTKSPSTKSAESPNSLG